MSSPIFDALGHPCPSTEAADSRAKSASPQTPSPAPTDGFSVTPSGRETTARSIGEPIRPSGSVRPSALAASWKSYPEAVEALSPVSWPKAAGSKRSRPQPLALAGLPETWGVAVALPPPPCQEVAVAVKVRGEVQSVGIVR